ncbi:MAG: arylsulfatase [Chloroflexi bacterium]|nr:arylsulfatase [Chloroflexota bacterium]
MSRLPNIVYIMADDLGYGDLSCYGARKIQTPHIDRIAAQGIRLTDVHSTSAVCTPSRYSVLTGRYCWRTHLRRWVLWGFEPPLIEPTRLTTASLLKQHGYATAAIGKWHLGLGWSTKDGQPPTADGVNVDYHARLWGGPLELGFDTCFCLTGSLDMAPYVFIEDDHCLGIPTVEKSPYYAQQRPGLMVPDWDDYRVDTAFTERAVAFIDRQAREHPNQPFFLYLTPSAPHRPCLPPDFIRGASQAGPRGDMVALVDWMVGQVEGALARHGLVENTLILVTSDNGARPADIDGETYGHKSCGDLRGYKADIWDGGHREPLVARWPGHIAPGSESDALVCLGDLLATVAEIVEHPLPPDAAQDSFSMLPHLTGKAPRGPIRPDVVHHSGNGLFSLRRGEWKCIMGLGSGGFSEPRDMEPEPGGPRGQLYQMADDPGEQTNLWLERPDVVAELSAILERYRYLGFSRPGAQE